MRVQSFQIEQFSPKITFYLFVNTKSGNREGSKLLQFQSLQQSMSQQVGHSIQMHFINLFDSDSLADGFNSLYNQAPLQHQQIYVIICGGDGTVSWVINQLAIRQIKTGEIIFGVLPIGTGNDLCRSLGWSGESFKVSFDSFVTRIKQWLTSSVDWYDLWEVNLTTFESGKVYNIHSQIQKQHQNNTFSRVFTNFVGLGVDARVTYTMELHRTSSVIINKILYAIVGCLYFFKPLKQLFTSIFAFRDKSIQEQEFSSLFSHDASSGLSSRQSRESTGRVGKVKIKSGYRGLVCLNSSSFMCGVRNIWSTPAIATKSSAYKWKSQSSSDGMVQFVAFRNQLNLGLQRFIHSGGKVAQGSGPFEIEMKRVEGGETTYIEIDGESIKVRDLRSMEIQKTHLLGDTRIRVLIKK